MEIRQLASARPVTVINGDSERNGNFVEWFYSGNFLVGLSRIIHLCSADTLPLIILVSLAFVCQSISLYFSGLASLMVPAATIGALGYGYMWWKV